MKIRPAACIIRNNEILLMRYEYGDQSVYNFPGGNKENGETLEVTLVREMQEELGIGIKVNSLLLIAEVIQNIENKDVIHFIFKCDIIDNEPIINKNETSAIELAWVDLEEIRQLNLYPNIGKELLGNLSDRNNSVYLGEIKQIWY